MLAIESLLAGGHVSFVGNDSADDLFLRVSDTGLLEFSESGDPGAYSTDLDSHQDGPQTLPAALLTSVTVDLGAGDDRLNIGASLGVVLDASAAALSVQGGAGNDVLAGPQFDVTWRVVGENSGTLGDTISFVGVENLTGAADNEDTFVFEVGGSIAGVIDGGPGGFDSLVFEGDGYQQTVFTSTGPHSGTVYLDDLTVVYDGLEPITVTGTANVLVTGSAADDRLILEPDPGNPTTMLRVRAHGTIETPSFGIPTGSLTINGAGGNDIVEISGSINMPGANLTINSEQIQVNSGATVAVTTGNINLAAAHTVTNSTPDGQGITAANANAQVTVTSASLTAATVSLTATASATATDTTGTDAEPDVDCTSQVIVSGASSLTATTGALTLAAQSTAVGTATATASSSGGSTSSDAAKAISEVDSTAIAHVGGSSSLSAGTNLSVTAANIITATTTADGSNSGDNATGATLAWATVNGNTDAYIDSAATASGGTVIVSSASTQTVNTTSKSTAGGSSDDGTANNTETERQLDNYDAETSEGDITIAGALAITDLTSDTDAYITSSGAIDATAGNLDITSSATTTSTATADASATEGQNGVGVAVAINLAEIDSTAAIGGSADLSGTAVHVQSTLSATNTFRAEATSGAGGEEVGVAGSLALNVVSTSSEALVTSAATADVGNAPLQLTALSTTGNTAKAAPNDPTSGGELGVGASVALNVVDNTTRAEIEDTAAVTNAQSLALAATGTHTVTTEAENGAGGSVGVSAAVAIATVDNTTRGRLGSGQQLTLSGPASITANHTNTVQTTAQAEVAGDDVGVGASVAINVVDDKTNAELARNLTTGGTLTVTATTDHASQAESKASAKGQEKEKDDGSPEKNADEEAEHQLNGNEHTDGHTLPNADSEASSADSTASSESGTGSGGVGVAAAVSVNVVEVTNTATIADSVTVTSGGAVQVIATQDVDTSAQAMGTAMETESDVNVGAAVALNVATVLNKARVGAGAQVTGNSIAARAVVATNEHNQFQARAIAGAGADQLGVAASLGINVVTCTTEASAGNNSQMTASAGGIDLKAESDIELQNVAGGGGLGISGSGAGAGAAINVVTNTTTAAIGSSASADATGTVLVEADASVGPMTETFSGVGSVTVTSFATGLGASGGSAAVAGSASINVYTLTTEAYIDDSAQINTGSLTPGSNQDVTVRATDTTKLISGGGGLGATIGGPGVGIGLDVAVITKDTRAYIGSSATVNAAGDVTVDAQSSEEVLSVAACGGLSLGATGVAASIGVVVITGTTEAYVDDSTTVSAGGDVTITAQGAADITLLAGGLAFGVSGGLGVSSATLVHNDTVEAYVGQNANVQTSGTTGLNVSATSTEEIVTIACTGSVTTSSASVAASATVNVLDETTHAYIDAGAQATASSTGASDPGIEVAASDSTELLSIAGSLSVAGTAGFGVGADVGDITKDTQAFIVAGVTASADGDVKIDADSVEEITSFSVAGGAGSSVSVMGSADVYVVDITTRAFIGDDPDDSVTPTGTTTVHADGNVVISADDANDVDLVVGTVSVTGSVGFGAAGGVTVIDKETEAFIGAGADVTGEGFQSGVGVHDGQFTVAYSAATASLGDLDPADGTQPTTADGQIGLPPMGGATVDTNQDSQSDLVDPSFTGSRSATPRTASGFKGVAVTTTNKDDVRTLVLGGGVSGTVAVSVSAAVNVVTTETRAFIDDGAKVNDDQTGAAAGQSVLVAAGNDFYHLGVGAVVSAATTASGSPGIDVNSVSHTVEARVGADATVEAKDDVAVIAQGQEHMVILTAGLAAGAVAIGGGVTVLDMNNDTQAVIGAGAVVSAGGDVFVSAVDDTDITTISGAVGIGYGGAGAAGSVGVLMINKDTRASIGNGAQIDAKGTGTGQSGILTGTTTVDTSGHATGFATGTIAGVIVQAESSEDVLHLAVSAGANLYFALAGGVTVTLIDSDTTALIGDNAQINQTNDNAGANAAQSVYVNAANEARIQSFAGALGVGAVGLAGGVDVGTAKNDTLAIVKTGADVTAARDMEVNALSIKELDSFAVSGAGGLLGLSAAISVWSIGTPLVANYSDSSGGSANAMQNGSGGAADQYAANQSSGGSGQATGLMSSYTGTAGNSKTNASRQASVMQAASTLVSGNAPTSTQITNAVNSAVTSQGTQAVIESSAAIDAGNNIEVVAREHVEAGVVAGAAAAGLGAVGAGIAVLSIDSHTHASVSGQLDAGNGIAIEADFVEDVDVTGLAGGLGYVGLGAAVVVLSDDSTQFAFIGDNAEVLAANSVNVTAHADQTLDTTTGQLSAGVVALGASFSKIDADGQTKAYVGDNVDIGQSTGTVGTLTVTADSDIDADAHVVGIAAGAVSVSANFAFVDVSPDVEAYIGNGSDVDITGSVTVQALVDSDANADMLTATLGIGTAGITKAAATADGIVKAYIVGDVTATGSLTVLARTTNDATAYGDAATAGIVAGVGAHITATASPTVQAYLADDASLVVTGDVSFTARSESDANANARGYLVSAVGLGTMKSRATVSPSVDAHVGDRATVTARNVNLLASHNAGTTKGATARADTSGGGLLNHQGADAVATANATVDAYAGSGAWLKAGEDVSIVARACNTANATGNGNTGGLAAVGEIFATATASGTTRAYANDIVPPPASALTAGDDLIIRAQGGSVATAYAEASTDGVAATFREPTAIADAAPTVRAYLTSNGKIEVGKDAEIEAEANGAATADAVGAGGSIYTEGTSAATAKWRPTVEAYIGGGTTELVAGDSILVRALSNYGGNCPSLPTNLQADATAVGSGGGLASIQGANARAETDVTVLARIAAGGSVTAGDDLDVEAGSQAKAVANASGNAGGLVSEGSSIATADMKSDVRARTDDATASDRTQLAAGSDLNIKAEADNVADVDAAGDAGGLVGSGGAEAKALLTNPITQARVGNQTFVNAPNATMDVEAENEADLNAYAYQETDGGVVNNEAKATTQIINSQTLAEVGTGVNINVYEFQLAAVDKVVYAEANSHARVPFDLVGDNRARAIVDADLNPQANIYATTATGNTTHITAADQVTIVAGADSVTTKALAHTATTGLTGNLYATADNDKIVDVDVLAQTGSYITATDLVVRAYVPPADPNPGTPEDESYIRSATADANTVVHTFVRVIGYVTEVVCNVVANIICVGGLFCSPKKICNTVTRAVTETVSELLGADVDTTNLGTETNTNHINFNADVTIAGGSSPQLVIGPGGTATQQVGSFTMTSDATSITLGDIQNTATSGSILIDAPGGSTSGVSPVHFNTAFNSLTITNQSAKDLIINDIEVYNTANPPTITESALNGQDNWTYNLTTNASGCTVTIENTSSTAADIRLEGEILNPSGTTIVRNAAGDILTNATAFTLTQQAQLRATQGKVGSTTQHLWLKIPVGSTLGPGIDEATGHQGVYLQVTAMAGTTGCTSCSPLPSPSSPIVVLDNIGSAAGDVVIDVADALKTQVAQVRQISLVGGGTVTGIQIDDTFDPSTAVVGDTITPGYAHGLATGESIVYSNGGGTSIGGLTHGRWYRVINVNANDVQLGNTFAPSTAVDSAKDTITFANPHGLLSGDKIVYDSGMTAISGLTDGSVYYVRYIDSTTIKLAGSLAEAMAPLREFDHTQIANNTITFSSNHDFTTGQALTYRASGVAITGLTNGNTYYAVKTGATTIQLAATLADATAGTPTVISLNAANATGKHRIGTEGIDMGASTDTTTHGIVIDLDGSAATGSNHQLLASSIYIQVSGGSVVRVQNSNISQMQTVFQETNVSTDSIAAFDDATVATGDMTVTAGNTTQVKTCIAATGDLKAPAGTMSLTTLAGNIVGVVDGANTHLIQAMDHTFSAARGWISGYNTPGAAVTDLRIDSTGGPLDATAQDDIVIVETTGDLNVGTITSSQGDVDLTSTNGNIIGRIGGTHTHLITCDDLMLTANQQGIYAYDTVGATTTELRTDLQGGQLDARAFSDIFVAETAGAMRVGRVVSTSVGDIRLHAPDTAGTGEDMEVLANELIHATNGDVTLLAGDNVTIPAAAQIQAAQGTVTIRGDHNSADPSAGTVIAITGQITANLVDVYGNADGDTVTLAATTAWSPTDVRTVAGDDTINFHTIDGPTNVYAGDDDDTINLGTASGLPRPATATGTPTVVIDGQADDDTFNINATSPTTLFTLLQGGTHQDQFVYSPGTFVLFGRVDGGSGNDTLDYSNYGTVRFIQLTGIGSIDGSKGKDRSNSPSLLPTMDNSFDNIDLLKGTAGSDTLQGSDLRNHWDLASPVSGVIVADESDLSLTGNGEVIGRPTGSTPIDPSAGETRTAYDGWENLAGGSREDRFDFQNGVVVGGWIDGRGGNDTLDLHDWPAGLVIDLSASPADGFQGTVRLATGGSIVQGNIKEGTGGDTGSSIENAFGGGGNDTITGDGDDNVLGDGYGSDTLSGGLGNDRYRLEPNGTDADVLNETANTSGGTDFDTVDFKFAGQSVTIDMDVLNVGQFVFDPHGQTGPTVRLNEELPAPAPSAYENFIGSQHNDLVLIDPLPGIPRSVCGNLHGTVPPGDRMCFEADGNEVIDSGSSLTATGVGTVFYDGIELFDYHNDYSQIIDNGDTGWSYTGSWRDIDNQGHDGDVHYVLNARSTDVATWTFDGIPAGDYIVSATWTSGIGSDRDNSVAYFVTDPARSYTYSAVNVNQRLAPVGFADAGSTWQELGIFHTDGESMVVQLINDATANGFMIADAVRIDLLRTVNTSTGLQIVDVRVFDGTSIVENGVATADFGAVLVGATQSRTYTIRNVGTTTVLLSNVLAPAGYSIVGMPTQIAPNAAPQQFTVVLDGLVGGQPQAGIYSGDLTFDFGHQGALPGERDTFDFRLVGSVVATGSATGIVIDDGDPQGFSAYRFRHVPTDGRFHESDYHYQVPSRWGTATYTFTGLDPNACYRVSSHWYPWSNRSVAAPYTLSNGAGTSQTVSVNQRIAPDRHDSYFIDDQGVPWADVHTGFWPGSDGRLIVQLSGAPDGYVIADAVRVDKVVAAEIAMYEVLAGGGTRELVDGRSEVPFGFTDQGNPLAKTFEIKNVGTQPLSFEPPKLTLPDGYSLLSSSYNASAAAVTLTAGQSHTFTLQLDADMDGAPEGTVSLVNTDSDENPFDFRIRGAIGVNIIDNNDAGFRHTGYRLVPNDSRFYLSDYHYEVPAGTDTATWTFTGLVPGNTYQLAATWYAWPNRATDATYIVSDNTGELGRASVNQRLAPDSYVDRDESWEELVTVTLPTTSNGTVNVSLSGSTTGYTIADAVRIASFHLPEILVELDEAGSRQLLQSRQSTIDFGSAMQLVTVTPKRIVLTNTGDLPLLLDNLWNTAASDFPIVDDVPGDTTYKFFDDQTQQWATSLWLGANQSASFWVGQDTSNEPHGLLTGEISFTTSDVDERTFELGVQGEVVGNFHVIDNDNAGFSHGRLRWVPDDSRFYQRDYRYTLPGQADHASWTFTNLAAGWYRASTTWFAWPNRPTNLVYTVSSTPVPAVADRPTGWTTSWQSWSSEPVDQRQDPSGGPGTIWEALVRAGDSDSDSAVWVPDGGTVVVTMNTHSGTNGYAVADAARIDFAPDLEPGGSLHAVSVRGGEGEIGREGNWQSVGYGLTTAGVAAALNDAVVQWRQTGLTPAEHERLTSVRVQAAHLPGTLLGYALADSPVIYLDDDAAGFGWSLEGQRAKYEVDSSIPHSEFRIPHSMDLVTVLAHELGHLLGHDHDDGHDVMSATLAAGEWLEVRGEGSSDFGFRISDFRLSSATGEVGQAALHDQTNDDPTPYRTPRSAFRVRDTLFARLDNRAGALTDDFELFVEDEDTTEEVEDALDLWGMLF